MPVHPFCGRKLPLVHPVVTADGRRYLDLAVPDGTMLRVPVEWTDRGAPVAPPRIDGRDVRLSARWLLELAGAVADMLDQQRGQPHISEQASIEEPPSGPVDAAPATASHRSEHRRRPQGRRRRPNRAHKGGAS